MSSAKSRLFTLRHNALTRVIVKNVIASPSVCVANHDIVLIMDKPGDRTSHMLLNIDCFCWNHQIVLQHRDDI